MIRVTQSNFGPYDGRLWDVLLFGRQSWEERNSLMKAVAANTAAQREWDEDHEEEEDE